MASFTTAAPHAAARPRSIRRWRWRFNGQSETASRTSSEYADYLSEIEDVDVVSPPGMDDRVGAQIKKLAHLDVFNLPDDRERWPTFAELSEPIYGSEVYDEFLAPLDRIAVEDANLSVEQAFWRRNGYIIFRNLVPSDVIDPYMEAREQNGLGIRGWPTLNPFADHAAVRALVLYPPLIEKIRRLIGYHVAVHFNLSHFTSTDRGWHQDDYMYSRTVMATNVAAWIALGDIATDMGPFEYVPGSHRWPWMRKWLVSSYLKPEVMDNPDGKYEFWAHYTEKYVDRAVARRIVETGADRRIFMARRGDVLLWHGGLMHRGLPPITPGIARPSMISHYLDPRRHDCGGQLQVEDGRYYYSF
jgi:hypothetical protein